MHDGSRCGISATPPNDDLTLSRDDNGRPEKKDLEAKEAGPQHAQEGSRDLHPGLPEVRRSQALASRAVSYTHLTLPTIYSV